VSFALVDAEKANHKIAHICRVLDVSRAGYYAWCKREPSARQSEDTKLRVLIREAHERGRRKYGRPRIHRALKNKGIHVSGKRVMRLMREENIIGRAKRRFKATTDSAHNRPVAANLLKQDFTASAKNKRWVGDTTELRIGAGEAKLYLAAIIDLYSRMVVGWALSEVNDRHLTIKALEMALRRRSPDPGLIHHSDRGSPYASEDYQTELEKRGIVCSMSRKGNCYDNAVMESWFSTLKQELGEHFDGYASAKAALFDYIEAFYNSTRMHSSLDYESPMSFEAKTEAHNAA
jgi:transposase InsO family protein